MITLFAIAVLIPLALNGLASRFDFRGFVDAFGLSVMVVLFWSLTNVMAVVFNPPASKALHPLIDFIGLSICVISWRTHKEWFKLVLSGLYLAQIGLHATFWVEWATQPHGNLLYQYALTLNITWLMELVVLAMPGGGYVVGRAVDWGIHNWRVHHHTGHLGS